jgi:hypothetical protein
MLKQKKFEAGKFKRRYRRQDDRIEHGHAMIVCARANR